MGILIGSATTGFAGTASTYGIFSVYFYDLGESYTDFNGTVYTSSKTWTAAEIADVGSMLTSWQSYIDNDDPCRSLKLNFAWSNTLSSGTLYSSTIRGIGNKTNVWNYLEYLWQDGVNNNSSQNDFADASCLFNSNLSWTTGSSTTITSTTYDFESAVAKSMGGALGLWTNYISSTDVWGRMGITTWDSLLYDAATGGNQPLARTTGTPGDFLQNGGTVYFAGAEAMRLNGGSRVAIYAPSTYAAGSSLVTLDESLYSSALFSTILGTGEIKRTPTMMDLAILKDLGWELDPTLKMWANFDVDSDWGNDDDWFITGKPTVESNVIFSDEGLKKSTLVNLNGDRSVHSLTFQNTTGLTIGGTTGSLTIASGSITQTSGGTVTIARPVVFGAAGTWDIAGTMSVSSVGGTYALTKSGSGALKLTGVNTYTGGTTVKEGSLELVGGGASSAFSVSSGATLTLSGGTNDITTLTNGGTGTISAGSHEIDTLTNSTTGTFTISGGSTDVNLFTNGGTVGVSGGNHSLASITNSDGAVFRVAGGTLAVDTLFTNNGSLSFSGGLTQIKTYTNTNSMNMIAGKLEVDDFIANGNYYLSGGSLTVNNTMTNSKILSISKGHGVIDTLTNTGTVTVSNIMGSLSIQDGTNTGALTLSSGTVAVDNLLTNGGTITLTGGKATIDSLTNGGTMTVSGGLHQIDNMTNTGSFSLTGGTVALQTSANTLGGTVSLTGGALNLMAAASTTSSFTLGSNFVLNGGTIGGDRNVNVTGFSCTKGTYAGSATVNITSGGTFSLSNSWTQSSGTMAINGVLQAISGGTVTLNNGVSGMIQIYDGALVSLGGTVAHLCNNSGTLNINGGSVAFNTISNTATGIFRNLGGTLSIGGTFTNQGALALGGGVSTFNSLINNYAVSMSKGTAQATIIDNNESFYLSGGSLSVKTFTNDKTMSLNGGTANIDSLTNGGTITISKITSSGNLKTKTFVSSKNVTLSDGILSVDDAMTNTGIFTLSGGNATVDALTNGGTMTVSGGLHQIGVMTNTGSFSLTGGTVALQTSANTLGGTVSLTGGALKLMINAASTSSFTLGSNFVLNGGTIGGDRNVNVTGFSCTKGTYAGSATVSITSGGTFSIANSMTINSGSMAIDGTIKALAGGTVALSNGSSGIIQIDDDAIFTSGGTAKGTLTNAGTITRLAGKNVIVLGSDWTLNNSGAMFLVGGTSSVVANMSGLGFKNSVANSGAINVGVNSKLLLSDGITGNGTLNIYGRVETASVTGNTIVVNDGGGIVFGSVTLPSAAPASPSPVPEPSVLVLLASAILGGVCFLRRKK